MRPAASGDAAAIAAIYARYVTDTAITFEIEPPDADAIVSRMTATRATHPWLVAERDGGVVGYAYGYPYRTRAAYRWVAETAIYLAHAERGRGIGLPLYTALLEALTRGGYVAAIAGIALPNPASEALHARLGFRRTSVQTGIGFKHGGWHDVAFWQRDLAPRAASPADPVSA